MHSKTNMADIKTTEVKTRPVCNLHAIKNGKGKFTSQKSNENCINEVKKMRRSKSPGRAKRELTFDKNEPGRPTSSDDTAVQETRKKRKK